MQVIWLTHLSCQSVQMDYSSHLSQSFVHEYSIKSTSSPHLLLSQTTLFCFIADRLNSINQRCDNFHLHREWGLLSLLF